MKKQVKLVSSKGMRSRQEEALKAAAEESSPSWKAAWKDAANLFGEIAETLAFYERKNGEERQR